MTDSTTPAQRLNAAHRQIDKLTDEVATLSRVLAAQNQAIASIRREWRMWSDALLRIHTPEGIDASKWDPGKAYLVVEAHQVGDFSTYAYRTKDYGETWTRITSGVPGHPLSLTRSIQEDPERPGLLFLGTENRVYVSFDDGDHWQALINNLPPTPIYGLVVQEHFGDLVVGTYGRGFWILDDLSPLRQLTDAVRAAPAHLFEPRDAYRFNSRTSAQPMPADQTTGTNPPTGANIAYWLSEETAGSDVTVRYGRIGSDGQSKTKSLGDEATAARHAEKMIAAKTGKGYVEAVAS